jgi:hypothetical protein
MSGTGGVQWVGSLLTKGICELTVAGGSGDKVVSVAGGTVNRGRVSVAGGRATVPVWQDFGGLFNRGRVSVAGGRVTVPGWQDLGVVGRNTSSWCILGVGTGKIGCDDNVPSRASVRAWIWVRRTLSTDNGYGGAGAGCGSAGGGVTERGGLVSCSWSSHRRQGERRSQSAS